MNTWISQLNPLAAGWLAAIGRACWQGGLGLPPGLGRLPRFPSPSRPGQVLALAPGLSETPRRLPLGHPICPAVAPRRDAPARARGAAPGVHRTLRDSIPGSFPRGSGSAGPAHLLRLHAHPSITAPARPGHSPPAQRRQLDVADLVPGRGRVCLLRLAGLAPRPPSPARLRAGEQPAPPRMRRRTGPLASSARRPFAHDDRGDFQSFAPGRFAAGHCPALRPRRRFHSPALAADDRS